MVKRAFVLMLILICLQPQGIVLAKNKKSDLFFRGLYYQDWMTMKIEGLEFYHRLSSRLKLSLGNKPGRGWTAFMDIRSRNTLNKASGNQFLIYDARISYQKQENKLFFSFGQMNLYDTAGIGELTGSVIGYRLNRHISLGGYFGLEPDIYHTRWDLNYLKYGIYVRYRGHKAKQLSLSLNRLSYDGKTERQFLYSSILFPYKRLFVLYGNLEYEMDQHIKNEDQLSRLFLNARVNLSSFIDITANFSSGRGLDYHQFILEQSKNPTLQNQEIDRYYYNKMIGIRFSLKPVKSIRLSVSKRESEQKDQGIKNHTTQLGLSLFNIFKSGISIWGNLNINRGESSESNAYYISTSKNFGKLSWQISFANYYNGLYFSGEEIPQVVHLPDRKTLATNFFFNFNRSLAFSIDYTFSYQSQDSDQEHQFFLRFILRK